jgi:hypothetical protein
MPRQVTLALALALGVAALVAACAGGVGGTRSGAGAGGPTPDASITVTYEDGEGHVRRARIVCAERRDRLEGFLRLADAAEVCRRLAELGPFLTAPPPRDRVCAQVYGGPQRAHFDGRFAGRRVDRRFGRTDACEESDWDRVRTLLPRPV